MPAFGASPAGGAEPLQVVVHHSAGADRELNERRIRFLGNNRRKLVWLLPAFALGSVVSSIRTAQLFQDDPLLAMGAVIVPVTLLLGISAIWIWLQKRRATTLTGRLWFSPAAFYIGPHDEAEGLRSSAAFAADHGSDAGVPIVRIVLTAAGIDIVPGRGRNEPIHCPLGDLARVDVTYGGRRERGIRLTTVEGRQATFLVRPDGALTSELERLGGAISQDPLP